MIALCIVIVLLLVLLVLPVGVDFHWVSRPAAAVLKIKIGPLRFQALPSKRGSKGKEKPKQKKKPKASKGHGGGQKKQSLSASDIPELARLVLDILGRFRRHLSVDLLCLRFTAGGTDPMDAALRYGRANALLCALLPPARALIKLREEQISTALDFNSAGSVLELQIVATLQVWEIICLSIFSLSVFLRWRKRRRARTPEPPPGDRE